MNPCQMAESGQFVGLAHLSSCITRFFAQLLRAVQGGIQAH